MHRMHAYKWGFFSVDPESHLPQPTTKYVRKIKNRLYKNKTSRRDRLIGMTNTRLHE